MITISAENRNPQWKAKTLRQNGYVPASVYGGDLPGSISLQVPLAEAQRLARVCQTGDALLLKVEEKEYSVVLKEKTISILNESIEQLSFHAVKM